MAHPRIDTPRHLAAFASRNMSLSDWYVLSIPGQSPLPEAEVPRIAAAQSVGDPRGEVTASSCQSSLLKLKKRGWLQSVTKQIRQMLDSKVKQSGYGLPLYGLPHVGDIDLTIEGAKQFQQLSHELYGPFFFSEALIEKNGGRKKEIYLYRPERLGQIVNEAAGRKAVIELIGKWCIYWWKTFPSGYKITVSLPKVASE